MQHIDILIHILCLFSGIITALLGFLLYLKYRIQAIRSYAFFILTTTFTVAATTVYNYASYYIKMGDNPALAIFAFIVFEAMLSLINLAFSKFASGILSRSPGVVSKVGMALPFVLTVASIAVGAIANIGKDRLTTSPANEMLFILILLTLFLSFLGYSILIVVNRKQIENRDLKRALTVMAALFIAYIPFQAVVIGMKTDPVIIFLSRNLFYFCINVISVVFAAKYFFAETPSIISKIVVDNRFTEKYAITKREKEVMELLLAGMAIKEIGARLGRSFKTINNHIYNIYQKTGVGSKMELLNRIKDFQI